MGSEEDHGDLGLQNTVGDGVLNCPSSGMNTNPMSDKVAGMAMSSGSMFKSSSNRGDPFFGSGWDPLVSLNQSENFGGSSMVSHNDFASSSYPFVQYPSVSGLVESVSKLPCFGSGNFSEMIASFGLPESLQIANTGCPSNYPPNMEVGSEKAWKNVAYSQEDCQNSDDGSMEASPNGKRKKRALETHSPLNPNNKNVEGEQAKDVSEDSSGEKKLKIEQNITANFRGKQTGKQQAKDDSNNGEVEKENYIHVRARRGQATNSHSLAERVRRERISERMKLLQELVPGCNKITGKAVMLDEIINYVQSLQQQVEFLSMKLATVNPDVNVDIDRILSKDILHSRSKGAPVLGFGPGFSSSHPYPQGIPPGTLPGSTNHLYHSIPQNVWDNEFQTLLQMGFESNSGINNMGQNGLSKLEP